MSGQQRDGASSGGVGARGRAGAGAVHVAETVDEGKPAPGPVMPGGVRAGQVMGLVEVIAGLGARADVAGVAHAMGGDLAELLPVLDAAEALGLIRIEKAGLALTEEGRRFEEANKDRMTMLRATLAGMEPFRTAVQLGSRRGGVASEAVAESLARQGIWWHHEPGVNRSLVHALLLSWGVGAKLLGYNGRKGRFVSI